MHVNVICHVQFQATQAGKLHKLGNCHRKLNQNQKI